MRWTPDRHATLEEMAAEEKSAAEIARALGTTRNAVIGRAGRTGVKLSGQSPGFAEMGRKGGRPKGYKPPASHASHRSRPLGNSAYTLEERGAALAARLTGASWARSAGIVGASAITLHRNWQHDPEVKDAALAILQRAKRFAWKDRCARLALLDLQRQMVADHNADILAGLDNRVATIAHRRLAGEDLAAIARDFGFTRERARQLFMRAVHAGLKEPPGVAFLRDRSADAARKRVAQ